MKTRLRNLLTDAVEKKAELDRQALGQGGFAYKLAAQSMASHIDDLTQQLIALEDRPIIEQLEFRLKAHDLQDGSIPLRLISRAAEEIRQMLGYAALRLSQGGISRKRVPDELYEELDLRLAAILPGSSRLLITTASHRDLFNDGLSKQTIERIFSVLDSGGAGSAFLESVTDLGPSSAKRLRDLLGLAKNSSAEMDIIWRYSGEIVHKWTGSSESIAAVNHALNVTEINARNEVTLEGTIELLSKKERIHLKTEAGNIVRILFPKRLLSEVSAMHLDQQTCLRCSITETLNPYTGETSTFYELLSVVG